MELFCNLIMVVFTWIYMCVKTYRIIYQKKSILPYDSFKIFKNIYEEHVWEWNFMDLEQRERNIILD